MAGTSTPRVLSTESKDAPAMACSVAVQSSRRSGRDSATNTHGWYGAKRRCSEADRACERPAGLVGWVAGCHSRRCRESRSVRLCSFRNARAVRAAPLRCPTLTPSGRSPGIATMDASGADTSGARANDERLPVDQRRCLAPTDTTTHCLPPFLEEQASPSRTLVGCVHGRWSRQRARTPFRENRQRLAPGTLRYCRRPRLPCIPRNGDIELARYLRAACPQIRQAGWRWETCAHSIYGAARGTCACDFRG